MKHLLALSLTMRLAIAAAPPEIPLQVPDGPLIANYQAQANPQKPYVAQLFAPGEKPVPLLVDSPPDHFHHHGLMFALNVDATDFWSEKGIDNAGRQEVVETDAAPAGDGFRQRLRWLATDGTPLVDESRRVSVRAEGKGADAVHWLDWETTLTPAAGREAVRLSGAQYFGLGMRFLPEWTGKGKFIWADAATPPGTGGEKVSPGDWCAVHCTIEGRPVTVLMLAHPANPRPGEWFTLNKRFCYVSATLNLKNEPFTLAMGQSWTLRYSLAVLSTPADHARLANIAAAWKESNSTTTTKPPTPDKP